MYNFSMSFHQHIQFWKIEIFKPFSQVVCGGILIFANLWALHLCKLLQIQQINANAMLAWFYSSESEVGKLLLAMVGSICSWWWTVFGGDSGQYLLWCKLCNNALFEFCTSFSVLSVTLGENFFGNRSLFASTEWQDQIFSQIKLYLQTKACRVKPAEGLILRKAICAHNNFRRSSYLMSKVFFGKKFLEVKCHKHLTLIVSSSLFLF